MSLILSLWILLACAHVLGHLAERLRQPALLGHMLAGILVGPSVLGWLQAGPGLAALVDFSVLFVVLTAGLEMRLKHLLDVLRGSGMLALSLGFLIPAAAAAVFTYAWGMAFIPGTVTALCVSVTALPVALRILTAFGLLNTRVARIAIASSLLADLIVLLVLGVLIAVWSPEHAGVSLLDTAGLALAKLLLLLALVGVCHVLCGRVAARRQREGAISEHSGVIVALLCMLGLGVISERLGFHFVIGVFFASLLVTEELIGDAPFRAMTRSFELMTMAVFAPLFLAYQGIQFEIASLRNAPFVVGLILIAVGSKMLGGYAAARWKRLPHYEAWGVAIILNARGVMEMVVASIAFRAGLVTQELFSVLLIVGIATTVITPSLLKHWLRDETRQKAMLRAGEANS